MNYFSSSLYLHLLFFCKILNTINTSLHSKRVSKDQEESFGAFSWVRTLASTSLIFAFSGSALQLLLHFHFRSARQPSLHVYSVRGKFETAGQGHLLHLEMPRKQWQSGSAQMRTYSLAAPLLKACILHFLVKRKLNPGYICFLFMYPTKSQLRVDRSAYDTHV